MSLDKAIDISKLLKAREVFERFRTDMIDDRDKAGAVQAFEFCFELSWKMMKRVLGSRGLETGSPKETFRQAALDHLIEDPELWFEFQKIRNLTTHTYNEENLNIIVDNFDLFSTELNKLVEKLQSVI